MPKQVIAPNRLREYRDRARLTLEEVSTLTGYNFTTVSKHENMQRSIDEEAIRRYAKIYKVQTHELFQL